MFFFKLIFAFSSPTPDPRKSNKELVSDLSKENLRKDQMKEMTTPSATAIIKEPSRPSYGSSFIDNS